MSGESERLVELVPGMEELLGELTPADVRRALRLVEEQEAENPIEEVMTFEILGVTKTSKRPRNARIKKNGVVVGTRTYAPDGTDIDRLCGFIMDKTPEGHVPFAGEIEMRLEISLPMPSSFSPARTVLAEAGYIRPDRKPDYDNYAKLVTDAMTGVVFVDDGQVVAAEIALLYSRRPRLSVVVQGRRRRIIK